MKTLHWITFAPKIVFAKIIFCTCTYDKISISQEFFLLAKKLKLFILYLPWLLEKKQLKLLVSLAFALHQNKKKIKTKFRIAGTEVWYIFRIFFNGFSKHALATNCRNAWSLRQLVQAWSTQIAAPSPTPLTPCTSTIKDIETLINKVEDFPILWDKSCA